MRKQINLNEGWSFVGQYNQELLVDIPHTWNALDGQDGGNDYYRGACRYTKSFSSPLSSKEKERVYLEFHGVNSSAEVVLNGKIVTTHNGGYSTFRVDITSLLCEENTLDVIVDNGVNRHVYPQQADFTFYGGIYRDVVLLIVPAEHFDLDYFGSKGIKITPTVDGTNGKVRVQAFHNTQNALTRVFLHDREGNIVAEGVGEDITLQIPQVHLWQGVRDPYIYTAEVQLERDGQVLDVVKMHFGVRSVFFDPQKGVHLNGKPYPLRGVSRHQDWKSIGNAISKEHHKQDIALIREMGANSIRLAHYQHDQYFYDLCDAAGLMVWAEIPYISSHMPEGRENTLSQMKELIVQNYHHPCIITWGISNEITISTKNSRDMYDNHRALNDLCHDMDATRPTSLACYAMCPITNPTVHITDLVGYNLYLGWYVPGLWLNNAFMKLFHKLNPNRCLGYSEFGAEGMPNLHSSKPRRGDHSEEYQAIYHEYMLKCFERHPFLWCVFVWNMFDFAADARCQGGEAGMNHKGLVTFDRQIKKDSFYLYKAWWSEEPFVHLCGKRYIDRPEAVTTVKIYSNQQRVSLYSNGKMIGEQTGNHVFTFQVPLEEQTQLEAVAGEYTDTALIRRTLQPNPAYKLRGENSKNWV